MAIAFQGLKELTARAILTGQKKDEIVVDLMDAGIGKAKAEQMVQEMNDLCRILRQEVELCSRLRGERRPASITPDLLLKTWPVRDDVGMVTRIAAGFPFRSSPSGMVSVCCVIMALLSTVMSRWAFFVVLASVALGWGVVARRTASGKTGLVISGMLLLLFLYVRHSEP